MFARLSNGCRAGGSLRRNALPLLVVTALVMPYSLCVGHSDVQPTFPIRAVFYYPWFPEAWTQENIYPFTHYHPSNGFYDNSDPTLLASHVADLQYAGMDAGIASWWGQGTNTDHRFPRLLNAANNTSFRWCVYYEPEGYGDPTVTQLANDIDYIVTNYGQNSAYLRVNGKPVIFSYADPNDGCGMVDRWVQANQGRAYIVLKVFAGYLGCTNQPDSWHQYAPAFDVNQQGSFAYFVSPGFYKADEPTPRLIRDVARFAIDIQFMIASNANWQLITTYNEWGEGTAVESANEWSSVSGHGVYIDVLHNYLRVAVGNISTRSFVQTGDNVMIGGFIVQGTRTKRVIIRAIGPELSQYGVPNVLADPTLELHNGTGGLIASNDNWQTTQLGGIITSNQVSYIQNSGYAPTVASESAIIANLQPGNYTAIVRGKNNTTGVALVEVYDLNPWTTSVLGNISTRSFVQTSNNVMIGGFIVQGTRTKRVIVRAIGPELTQHGVPNALADPTLELHNGTGALIGSNDNWQNTIIGGIITTNQVSDIQNSGHAPTAASESAIIATLQPDNYTAIVRGVNNTTGVALVEVYDLDR